MDLLTLLRKQAVERILPRPTSMMDERATWRVQAKSDTGKWADVFASEDPHDALVLADYLRETGETAILRPISRRLWLRITKWSTVASLVPNPPAWDRQ